MNEIKKGDKIFVAGHRGLVGSAIVRSLETKGYRNILTRSRAELDLIQEDKVESFLQRERPDVVILAAAKVGGIHANSTYRTEFILENLRVQNNLIGGSFRANVDRLIFLGSTCIYPRDAAQPIREESLLTGPLEPSNRPYALAKIAGLELVSSIREQFGKNYFSVMPTNLYGPGDNFHPENSHVLPALIRRFVEAREVRAPEVVIWGSGAPLREFLYVDDAADAITYLLERVDLDTFKNTAMSPFGWSHINLGSGAEVSIRDLAMLVGQVVGYEGELKFDATKLDGTPRKLTDTSLLNQLGWRAPTPLREGLERTVRWYLEHSRESRSV